MPPRREALPRSAFRAGMENRRSGLQDDFFRPGGELAGEFPRVALAASFRRGGAGDQSLADRPAA